MTNAIAFDFSGSRVVVTGGTSGIGHATATAFAQSGATVTVTGTKARVTDYEADLSGLDFRQLVLDDQDSLERFVKALEQETQSLDVLVNNAGANMPGGVDEWDPDGFAHSVAINLTGPMRLTVLCHDLLATSGMAGGASVVNLASMAAYRTQTIVPGYGAAKAAVVNLTANLANHWAADRIRVNAVAPGLIDTPMTAPMASFPELLEGELAGVPMRRMAQPIEIVDSVLFLCSTGARYMTGHTIAVDGGYLAG